jgi:hypothetical protein
MDGRGDGVEIVVQGKRKERTGGRGGLKPLRGLSMEFCLRQNSVEKILSGADREVSGSFVKAGEGL